MDPLQITHPDGSAVQVQVDRDTVVIQQSTAGVVGRGAGVLTAEEARQLADYLRDAADAAEVYEAETPPSEQPPVAQPVLAAIEQLGGADAILALARAIESDRAAAASKTAEATSTSTPAATEEPKAGQSATATPAGPPAG